jgi:hypothetical protein
MNSDAPLDRVINRRFVQKSGHFPQGAPSMVDSNVCDASASWALSHPAIWLSLALILTVLEGAVRKWIPGFQAGAARLLVYFSKDVAFTVGALLIFSRQVTIVPALVTLRVWALPAVPAFLVGGAVSLIQGLNAVGAFLTLRAVLILPFFGYCYAARVRAFPLMGFALVGVWLTLINAVLALYQNSLPADDILNQYASEEGHIVEVEYGVRATGTFAYITGLGVLSSLGVWGGMVAYSLARDWKQQTLGVLGIMAGLACAFASISRNNLVTAFLMLVVWLMALGVTRGVRWRGIFQTALVGGVIFLLFPVMTERFLHVLAGTLDRFESAGDNSSDRALGQWKELWQAVQMYPLGNGLGTEQIGGNYSSSGLMAFTSYESQFPRLVAEVGVIGFLGFALLVVGVILALQRTKRGSEDWRWNLVVVSTQVYLLGQFYLNLGFNHTGSSAIWLVATAVLAAAPKDTLPFKDRQSIKS